MTNVESMEYTHSDPSTMLAPLIPRTFGHYHTTTIYLPQNSHHTYLLWHFHNHSEIYCMQLSIVPFTMTRSIIVILLGMII